MAEPRYVRPTIAGWLTPTLLAPWITVYGAVTAFAFFGLDRGMFGKALGWTLGMLAGSVWSFVFCALLVVVDLALLAIRVRTLPTGKRGWLTALTSPLWVFATYYLVPPYGFYKFGPWAVAGALLVPMLVVAIGVRVFGGQKTLKARGTA